MQVRSVHIAIRHDFVLEETGQAGGEHGLPGATLAAYHRYFEGL
jgi:hypothetical protein